MADIRKVINVEIKEVGVEQATEDLEKLAGAANEATTETKELGDEVEQTGGTFVRLEKQLKEAKIALQKAIEAQDVKAVEKYRGEIDELNDKLDVAKIKAGAFDDQLSMLPGPAGAAGNAIKGIDGALKLMAANPIIAVIAVIVAALVGMYKSLQQTTEGTKVLNKITETFSSILKIVADVVNVVAIPVFKALGTVVEGLGYAFAWLTGNVDEYKQSLADAQAAKQFEENAAKIKTLLDEEGFKYDAITKKKIAADQKYNERKAAILASEDSQEEKRRRLNNAAAEKNKAIQEADLERSKMVSDEKKKLADKADADAQKALQNTIKRLDTEYQIKAALLGKEKALLDTKSKTEDEALQQEKNNLDASYALTRKNLEDKQKLYKQSSSEYKSYTAQLIQLDTQYIQNSYKITQDQKKLQEQRIANNIAFTNKLAAISEAAIEDDYERQLAANERQYQTDLRNLEQDKEFMKMSAEAKQFYRDELEAGFKLKNKKATEDRQKEEQAIRQTEIDAIVNDETLSFDQRIGKLQDFNKTVLNNAKLTEQQKIDLIKQSDAQIRAIEDAQFQYRVAKAQAYIQVASQLGSFLQQIAGKNKKVAIAGIAIEKAAAIGNIVANTAAANAKAVAASPLTGGLPWVAINTVSAGLSIASTIAGAVKAIQEINAAGADIGGASSGGGSISTAAPQLPAFSQGNGSLVPQIGVQQSQTGTIAGAVSGAIRSNTSNNSPIRAYVVGNDVTTQQQLDRRIAGAARLG